MLQLCAHDLLVSDMPRKARARLPRCGGRIQAKSLKYLDEERREERSSEHRSSTARNIPEIVSRIML
ncbi:hypothetical protein KOW79_010597 [Hemibagrus wyckioides]|uniref:Uncharacterized protein n=1 Tax=Hemibagrus wyckioides TaxID=337641 RepID=A0A9D3SIS8_9TELE|nr:hypothetical protein KOW79_010597 [Hemibagrus wyckioides]